MKLFRKALYYLLLSFATVLIIVTMASLLYETGLWYFKVLDFPRLPILIALVMCLTLFALRTRKWEVSIWLLLAGLMSAIAVQGYMLFPYTPLAAEAVAEAETGEAEGATISILVANVLMPNRKSKKLLEIVREREPTFLLVMEVDDWWMQRLSTLDEAYPHRIERPNDNTYGMALYSKLPLGDSQIQYLNEKEVPSFSTQVKLPDGTSFQLFTIHPVPPKPSEYPDNIGEKEVALMKAGRMIADNKSTPTLLAGDLNDVGWSYNSKRFETLSGLRDLRRGRGLYNTFDAKSLFMHWPLDYIYVSPEFKVLELERLDDFGSDHFPYYAKLVLVEK